MNRRRPAPKLLDCGLWMIAGLIVWGPLPLAAQQIVNATFDEDVSGWEASFCDPETPPAECPISWSEEDRSGSPDSGSLRLYKGYQGGSVRHTDECLPAAPGQAWSIVAQTRIHDESPPAMAFVQLSYWSGANCDADFLEFSSGNQVTTAASWQPSKILGHLAPPTTGSVLFRLSISDTSASVPVFSLWDDVQVGVFFSSFDDGLLDDWSMVLD